MRVPAVVPPSRFEFVLATFAIVVFVVYLCAFLAFYPGCIAVLASPGFYLARAIVAAAFAVAAALVALLAVFLARKGWSPFVGLCVVLAVVFAISAAVRQDVPPCYTLP